MADIPVTTADTLPPAFGGNREVKRMHLIKCFNYSTPEKAEESLKEWVRVNGYNAVIGMRFQIYPDVSAPSVMQGSATIRTEFRCIAYGTAIGW
jgi:hypothetical protein